MKKNLFELAVSCEFTKGSKTATILSEGASKHTEAELAKALLKTKAYKTNSTLKEATDAVLSGKVNAEQEVAKAPVKESSSKAGGERTRF